MELVLVSVMGTMMNLVFDNNLVPVRLDELCSSQQSFETRIEIYCRSCKCSVANLI